MSLGEQIREIRSALGWSQFRLAEKAGISQSVISDIESGRRNNPSIKTLWKIAKALGVSLSELLNIQSLNSLMDKE
ncbi:MAG: helix-turn-helix transcriptional regulator [Syntrophomonas sp.]